MKQVGHAGLPQPGGHLPQGGHALPGGQVPRVPQPQQPQAQPPHFGESLNESLRSLELPKIHQNCSALEFGDWLAVVGPLMADLSGSSSQWWALVLAAANEAYARWQVSTPLERLRLRVVFPLDIYRWPRTEQRAVTMLLAAVPDEIRREMIANRKLNSMDILFTLLCRFQPGGASERASLLRDISDPQLKQNANVQDFLTALRLWRRNLGRAVELGLQLPDPLILVNLLTRWADHLGRLGGAQLSYRVASLRQQLQLDTMPNSTSVVEFAEALQAEAEQLALSVQSTTSTSMTTLPSSSTASAEKTKKEPVKAAALQAEADSPKKGDTTTKAKCRFWGTPAGCKRADECKFEHSWDGIEKRGKCWACSSDQHMRNECPYKKKDGGSSPQKMAKVTGPKPKPTKSGKETKEGELYSGDFAYFFVYGYFQGWEDQDTYHRGASCYLFHFDLAGEWHHRFGEITAEPESCAASLCWCLWWWKGWEGRKSCSHRRRCHTPASSGIRAGDPRGRACPSRVGAWIDHPVSKTWVLHFVVSGKDRDDCPSPTADRPGVQDHMELWWLHHQTPYKRSSSVLEAPGLPNHGWGRSP